MANGTGSTRGGGSSNTSPVAAKQAEKAAEAPIIQEQKEAAKNATNEQPKFSQGTGKDYVLGKHEQEMLESGNTYSFAREVLKAHPDFCKGQGFDENKAQNSYSAYIDFSDGIYTFWGKGKTGNSTVPMKYFFNTKMKLVGTKL